MPEVATCPLCGEAASIFRLDDDPVTFSHCGMQANSVELWNRYAAAMELAEAKAWRKEVWEATRKPWNFVQVLRERKSIESVFDILDQSEEDVKLAEKRVLEVFK